MSTTATKPALFVAAAGLIPEALDMLGDSEVVFAGRQPTEDDIVTSCAWHKSVAVIVHCGKINAHVMDAITGNLQVASKRGSGINVIDQDAAAACGTAVCAVVGADATAVAKHTRALILTCAKSAPQLDARMRTGHWDEATHESVEPDGRTLGLVGLGMVGRRTAVIGLAFRIKILAFDPHTKEAPTGVQLVALGELYAQSNVISLHCPLIAGNRKMLNHDTFSCFKPGTILVNAARGGLIDETALIEALTNDRLRAAGLDSFDVEPMTAPYPFQGAANIILSPHTGGVSDAAYLNMGKGAVISVLVAIGKCARTTA